MTHELIVGVESFHARRATRHHNTVSALGDARCLVNERVHVVSLEFHLCSVDDLVFGHLFLRVEETRFRISLRRISLETGVCPTCRALRADQDIIGATREV